MQCWDYATQVGANKNRSQKKKLLMLIEPLQLKKIQTQQFVCFGHCDFRIGFPAALFSIQISFQLP